MLSESAGRFTLLMLTPLAVAASQRSGDTSGGPASVVPMQRGGTDPSAVIAAWFRHIERNETDSLRSMLTNGFRFVADGERMSPDAFVAMIKGLGIRSPTVRLRNVETHQHGDVAYLVYDRDETVRSGESTRTIPETGSVVLVRLRGRWKIAQWSATSRPR